MGLSFSISHSLQAWSRPCVFRTWLFIRRSFGSILVAAVKKQHWVGESQPASVGVIRLRRMVDLKLVDSASCAWRIKIDKDDGRRRRRAMTCAIAGTTFDFIVVGSNMSYIQLRRTRKENRGARKRKRGKRAHIERGRVKDVRLSHCASLAETRFGRPRVQQSERSGTAVLIELPRASCPRHGIV